MEREEPNNLQCVVMYTACLCKGGDLSRAPTSDSPDRQTDTIVSACDPTRLSTRMSKRDPRTRTPLHARPHLLFRSGPTLLSLPPSSSERRYAAHSPSETVVRKPPFSSSQSAEAVVPPGEVMSPRSEVALA